MIPRFRVLAVLVGGLAAGALPVLATRVLAEDSREAARAEAAAPSDPAAVAIADRVMAALGGRRRWDALRGLRWTFGVAVDDTVRSTRRHSWDKWTGWDRIERQDSGGRRIVVVVNVNDGTGRAWVNGRAAEGDSLRQLLELGKSLWINDAYWLLMPYKLRDPGVTLEDAGEAVVDGAPCDKIALSFARVGQTPGDHYWVYVRRRDDRVVKWDMVLQGNQPPPRSYTWEDWLETGGLWFATAHRDGRRNVSTRDIEVAAEIPAAEFVAP